MAGNVVELTDADFDDVIHKSDVPVLVDFWRHGAARAG